MFLLPQRTLPSKIVPRTKDHLTLTLGGQIKLCRTTALRFVPRIFTSEEGEEGGEGGGGEPPEDLITVGEESNQLPQCSISQPPARLQNQERSSNNTNTHSNRSSAERVRKTLDFFISSESDFCAERLPLAVEVSSSSSSLACSKDADQTNSRPSPEAFRLKGHFPGRDSTMLGVQYFCNSKIPNRFSANSRCFKPKQTPQNSPLQNDKPQLLKESIADSGLVGHARLKRCLLACSNSEESTQIPSANLLEHALPLQSLTVRPGPSTLAIHTSDGPSPGRSEGRRYSDSELHRRYNSVELGQSYSGTASSENKELSQRTRPFDKPSEIVSFSCLITSLGRDSLGRQQANVGSTGALIAENSRPSMLFTVPEEVFKKRVGKSGRVNCLRRSDKQKGETSVPPLGKTRSLQSIRRSRRSGSHPATSARFSKPLGKCERLGATRKICTSKSEHSVLDRCLQGGLGNSRSKQRKLSRSLDSERDRKPHKCPRIGNDTKGSIAARSIKPNSSSLVRQRGLNKCNSKTRISLPRAAKDHAKSTRGNVDKEHIHISKASSREEQCSSRRPIKNSRDCLRVADPRPRIQKIRAPPRNKTADRSICITSESQAGEVRLPFLLPNSVGNGRPEHRLESVSTDLSISPSRPLTNCSRETTFIPGMRNSYPQGGGALQANAPAQMSEGVETEASSVPRGSGGMALASRLRTLSRLEFLERCYHKAYGPEVAQDLVNSMRRSSKKQYESAWKRFQAWLPCQKLL